MLPPAIEVQVSSEYLKNESSPEQNHYVFSYTVTISNNSEHSAQLLSRHWIITNGSSLKTQEVKGDGVVGEQPKIEAGHTFTYTSGAVIDGPVGTMQGSYQMLSDEGESFNILIEPFMLAAPNQVH